MEPLNYRAIPPGNAQITPPPIPPELPTGTPTGPSFTPQNLRELSAARSGMKKIHRATGLALFEGFTIAIFGGLSVLAQLHSIPDVIFGIVLVVIGIIEILTARGVRRLEPKAARNLAVNQLVFAVLILAYASWNLYAVAIKSNGELPGLSAEQKEMLGQVDPSTLKFANDVLTILYASLIAGGVLEVGMAAYYYSRGTVIQKYLDETPPWIISMQKAGIPI